MLNYPNHTRIYLLVPVVSLKWKGLPEVWRKEPDHDKRNEEVYSCMVHNNNLDDFPDVSEVNLRSKCNKICKMFRSKWMEFYRCITYLNWKVRSRPLARRLLKLREISAKISRFAIDQQWCWKPENCITDSCESIRRKRIKPLLDTT